MKNFGFTILMMLFVGVGTSMAQDKAAAADSDAAVKIEAVGEKHACSASCAKACCSKEGAVGKKACTAEQKKQCAGHAGAAATEEKPLNNGRDASAKPKK